MNVHKVLYCPLTPLLSLLLQASGFLGCWQIRGCMGQQRRLETELNFPQLSPLERAPRSPVLHWEWLEWRKQRGGGVQDESQAKRASGSASLDYGRGGNLKSEILN